MKTSATLLAKIKVMSAEWPPSMQRQMNMVLHKAAYPMANILAKVPGDSLAERAKALKVSRQTMYVWLSEKYRPTVLQAKRIAKVTGVPIEHIIDNGFEVDNEAGRKARKKIARLAGKGRKNPAGDSDAAPKRRPKADVGEQLEGV